MFLYQIEFNVRVFHKFIRACAISRNITPIFVTYGKRTRAISKCTFFVHVCVCINKGLIVTVEYNMAYSVFRAFIDSIYKNYSFWWVMTDMDRPYRITQNT